MQISQRAQSVAASMTLEIDAKAKQMKAQGQDVIGFGAGEPDFNTPAYIVQAAKDALDAGYTRYTPASGLPALKEAICRKLARDNQLSYAPNQIVVSNGAKHSLYNAFYGILEPGDEVIIPSPYWVSYPEMVRMCGGEPVFVKTREADGFKMSADQLRAAITPRTRALVLNSPSNPCGCVYSRQDLEQIAQIVIDNGNIWVISDEVYEKLVYDGAEHISIAALPGMQERTVLVNGASKTYAMTGWRLGYTAAPAALTKVMSNFQSHATSNANAMAQQAFITALDQDHDDVARMFAAFAQRREEMVRLIGEIPHVSCVPPRGAFYLMVNISGLKGRTYRGQPIADSMGLAALLLEHEQVAVVPGVAFGDDDYVRLSYATSMENIQKGLARLQNFCKEVQ